VKEIEETTVAYGKDYGMEQKKREKCKILSTFLNHFLLQINHVFEC
jgi:hypothetical protein